MTFPTLGTVPLRRALLSLLLAATVGVTASAQTTYNVDSDSDDPAQTSAVADGNLTLREAIIAANTNAAYGDAPAGDAVIDDEINFLPAVTRIQLVQGELEITEGLNINGATEVGPQLDMRSRVFNITTTDEVEFGGITIRDGLVMGQNGGGVLLGAGGDLILSDVTFQGNSADNGGGLYVTAGAQAEVSGSLFALNRALSGGSDAGGGGIYTAGDVSLFDVTFNRNRATVGAGSGGGAFVASGGTLIADFPAGVARPADAQKDASGIFVATFVDNFAARAGGAIEVRDGGEALIAFSRFDGNRAGTNPGNGGALHITGAGSAEFVATMVSNNVAFSEGGGLWNSSTGTLIVDGGSITGNIARGALADNGGGGVFSDGGATTITDAIISNNSAIGAAGSGGGVFANGTTMFSISGTTISNNTAQRAGGGIEVLAGAITIDLTTFQSNEVARSPGNGGALHTSGAGTVTISNSDVSGNRAGNEGGGLWNSGVGTLTVTTTTIDGNVTPGNGGGVYQQAGASGVTTIEQSTLEANSASQSGGGVFAEGATMTITNSTLSGNTARFGGGGAAGTADVTVASSTIAFNTASSRGGGFSNDDQTARVKLDNTIVSDNSSPRGAQLGGFFRSEGNILVESLTGAGVQNQGPTDIYGQSAMLDALADNGGPTETHALMAGRPAIDAGDTDRMVDQRGEPRMDPDDIGSYDFGAMMAGPGAMIITGVFDGPLTGGTPKVIEVYVTEDIADLSIFGVGSANNGGGTDGEEFTFPAGTATAGDFFYIVDSGNADEFASYFSGFTTDYESSAAGINGDDAIELFMDGAVIDVFGDINVDGTGQPWDYLDGWAYRNDGTGPDGTTFVLGNWTYSGTDANDGKTTNSAPDAFPIGTYSPDAPAARAASATVAELTNGVRLDAVTPNPMRARAEVTFAVAEAQSVRVVLYDVMGRQVQEVFTGSAAANEAVQVQVDGSRLAAGVYVVVLQGESVRASQQVTVVR